MQPEVVDALSSLKEKGVVGDPPASHLLRVARGDLVSVRLEIRTLLYLGVLLLTTGVGLFVKENHGRIGPATIASALGLAAAACFFQVIRRAAPFTWARAAESGVALDYVLLLGLLLVAADLAYVEVQFRLLGPDWPYHLLVVALLSGAAAFRWDSPVALSFALSSFAAWRGVSVNVLHGTFGPGRAGETRGNAVVCGLLFVIGGVLLVRAGKETPFRGRRGSISDFFFFSAVFSPASSATGTSGAGGCWPWPSSPRSSSRSRFTAPGCSPSPRGSSRSISDPCDSCSKRSGRFTSDRPSFSS